MQTAAIISTVILLWSIAVLCKLVGASSRRVPYTFAQWDGGLALRGRVLGRTGTIALAVFCGALVAVSAYLLVLTGAS